MFPIRHLDQDQALHLSELMVVALRRELQQTASAPVLEPGAVDELKETVGGLSDRVGGCAVVMGGRS